MAIVSVSERPTYTLVLELTSEEAQKLAALLQAAVDFAEQEWAEAIFNALPSSDIAAVYSDADGFFEFTTEEEI